MVYLLFAIKQQFYDHGFNSRTENLKPMDNKLKNLNTSQRLLSKIKTWIEVLLLDYNSRGSYLTKCTEAINYSQVDASSKNIQMART